MNNRSNSATQQLSNQQLRIHHRHRLRDARADARRYQLAEVTAAFESFGIGVVRKSVVGDTLGRARRRDPLFARARRHPRHLAAGSGRPKTT